MMQHWTLFLIAMLLPVVAAQPDFTFRCNPCPRPSFPQQECAIADLSATVTINHPAIGTLQCGDLWQGVLAFVYNPEECGAIQTSTLASNDPCGCIDVNTGDRCEPPDAAGPKECDICDGDMIGDPLKIITGGLWNGNPCQELTNLQNSFDFSDFQCSEAKAAAAEHCRCSSSLDEKQCIAQEDSNFPCNPNDSTDICCIGECRYRISEGTHVCSTKPAQQSPPFYVTPGAPAGEESFNVPPAPTDKPTPEPTSPPSSKPTASPTPPPTPPPTQPPTPAPTPLPAPAPTPPPTPAPTSPPSPLPSPRPSPRPSPAPITAAQTPQPSPSPTPPPTLQPTATPTPLPTGAPVVPTTEAPTTPSVPSFIWNFPVSTPEPTRAPTQSPTPEPPQKSGTPEPTLAPIAESIASYKWNFDFNFSYLSAPLQCDKAGSSCLSDANCCDSLTCKDSNSAAGFVCVGETNINGMSSANNNGQGGSSTGNEAVRRLRRGGARGSSTPL